MTFSLSAYRQLADKRSSSYFLAAFLLLLYEIFIRAGQGSFVIINGVDAWFKYYLSVIPFGSLLFSAVFILIGLVFVVQDRRAGFRPGIILLLLMWGEAVVWSLILYLLLPYFIPVLPNMIVEGGSTLQLLGLCFGAGFYEELFFRLILVFLLSRSLSLFFSIPVAQLLAVALSAVIFSLAHFLGSLGDSFSWYAFFFRFFFGLMMSVLLVARKFGITSWTHALYDVWVVFL